MDFQGLVKAWNPFKTDFVSPLPDDQTMTSPKFAGPPAPPSPQPGIYQDPSFLDTLSTIRQNRPNVNLTDQQIYDLHKKYGPQLTAKITPGAAPIDSSSTSPLQDNSAPTMPALSEAGYADGTPDNLKSIIKQAATSAGIPTAILSSLLKQESGFNGKAQSPVGAQGIAQFMPETAKGMGIDPLNVNQAIMGAAKYLAQKVKEHGSIPLALAAYNAGSGNVEKYGGIPPFPETQNYVKNILASAKASAGIPQFTNGKNPNFKK